MIKCLENIPEKWKVGRVKDIFYISKEKAHQKDPVILSLARDGIKVRDISNNEGQIAESYENYNPVKPGDLLLNPMDLYSGANCNMSLVEGVISPAYVNLRKKYKDISPKFYDYYFKVQYWTMNMFAHGKGVSFDNRWTLNAEGVLNFEIPILSGEEQQKIVVFLDKKCSQIERLIKVQENEIEKLKEYKQSVVTEVVTKGLDKNAKMKDSGIEWIGEIPEYWSLVRFKDFFYNKKEVVGENSVSFDRLALTLDGVIKRNKDDSDGLQPKEFDGYQILRDNDFVFKMIDLQNISTSRVGLSPFTGIVSPAYIRFVNKKKCNNKYFYYFLMSLYYNEVYNNLGGNGVRSSLSASDMGNFICPYPNKIEQENIVRILDNKIIQIDNLIKQKNNKIEKLQDYKKSLIYEYVTGKKEV